MKTIGKSEKIIWLLWLLLLQDVNANFECPAPGRYLDILSDCERFFFCYEINGEVLYETFKCPKGRLYSVEETRCITASNLQCKEVTGATPIPSQFEKIDPIEEFICRGEGKFVNEFDSDCNTFITCTRISGQSYSMNLHYCPTGEIFSHYTFECVPIDQFQCATTQPTQSETSLSSTTVEEMSNEPETTASLINTNEIPISNENLADSNANNRKTSSELSPSTVDEYLMLPAENYVQSFECSTAGRFPNFDEPGCTTFILCTMANGTFFPAIFNCTESFFDPELGRCSLDYVCPDNTTPLPETTTNIPVDFECPRSGRYPNTAEPGCKNYIVCTGSGPFNIAIISCDGTDLYSPERGRCVPSSEYTCPDEFTTESTPSTSPTEFPTPTACTRIGRIPNYNEPGCGTYILCAKDENGMFISAINYCDNSFFDPNAGRCSLDYVCPENTTPVPETTTNIPVNFECPRSGRYPNTLEPGCKNYIFCKGNGPYNISIISCDGTDLYSPERGRCVPADEYTCPDEIETTTELTSTSVTDEETTSELLPTTTVDTTIEDTTIEVTTIEDTTIEVTTIEDTTIEDTTIDVTTIEDTTIEDTTIDITTIEETTISESAEPETELLADNLTTEPVVINGETTIELTPSTIDTNDIIHVNHVESETTESSSTNKEQSVTVPSSGPSQNPTTPSDGVASGITNTEANESITSTIDVSTYPPKCMADPVIQFICPDSGRYKDKDSTDCRTYVLCLRTVRGELVYAKLPCEEGTLYSDDARACVSTEKNSCQI